MFDTVLLRIAMPSNRFVEAAGVAELRFTKEKYEKVGGMKSGQTYVLTNPDITFRPYYRRIKDGELTIFAIQQEKSNE